jgi:hypothetical protein
MYGCHGELGEGKGKIGTMVVRTVVKNLVPFENEAGRLIREQQECSCQT